MRTGFLVGAMIGLGLLGPTFTFAGDDSSTSRKRVTFTRDVAPIFMEKCVTCHRPNEIAPMGLRDFTEARPWAKSIKERVSERTMPPWHADPAHGRFSNDRSLSESEVATIVGWVDQGAPQGDPADMPPLPDFHESWRLGEPDYVLEFGEEKLPAGGPDQYRYRYITFDEPEDRWVKAIELRASNTEVAHHAVVFYQNDPSQSRQQSFLGAWAPGLDPWSFPDGTGKLLKKGAQLILNMHYHPAEEEATDSTRIAFYFADEVPEREVTTQYVANYTFRIPAGDPNYEQSATYTFAQDSRIVAMLPHMHYRGKDMTYTATFPDGREEILLRVPKFDFNWQTLYVPALPIFMPEGTRIDVVAHWDNSEGNPFNPDPTKDVTYGPQSYDEMLIGFVDYVVDDGVRPREPAQRLTHSDD